MGVGIRRGSCFLHPFTSHSSRSVLENEYGSSQRCCPFILDGNNVLHSLPMGAHNLVKRRSKDGKTEQKDARSDRCLHSDLEQENALARVPLAISRPSTTSLLTPPLSLPTWYASIFGCKDWRMLGRMLRRIRRDVTNAQERSRPSLQPGQSQTSNTRGSFEYDGVCGSCLFGC